MHVKSKTIKFSFNSTSSNLADIKKLTLYFEKHKSLSTLESSRRNSTNYYWSDMSMVIGGKQTTYIGRLRSKNVADRWWKIKVPKRRIRNFNGKTSRDLVHFDLEIRTVGNHLKSSHLNKTFLYIEKEIPSTNDTKDMLYSRQHRRCMGNCCLQSLVVSFAEIGWDWVIEPKSYIANYCSGSCSATYMSPSDLARLSVQTRATQLMLKKLGKANTGSTCTVDTEVPVKVLYLDRHGNVKTNNNSFKTATSCKCA